MRFTRSGSTRCRRLAAAGGRPLRVYALGVSCPRQPQQALRYAQGQIGDGQQNPPRVGAGNGLLQEALRSGDIICICADALADGVKLDVCRCQRQRCIRDGLRQRKMKNVRKFK